MKTAIFNRISIVIVLMFIVSFAAACGENTVRADNKNDLYEITTPLYKSINRKALKPLGPISAPRFLYDEIECVYKNEATAETGIVTINFAGDLMSQAEQHLAAYDKKNKTYNFNASFAEVKSILNKADLVVGNLETMISETAPYMSEQFYVDDKPHLNAPATYLDAVKYAGFDVLTTANNHSCDTGYQGIKETVEHLNRYGFMHTGTFENEQTQRYLLADVNGIRIAILSYSTLYNGKADKYFNEFGQETLLNKYSEEKAQRDIANAKADGAEFVIVAIHWGKEYVNSENQNQRLLAKQLAGAGADYIIGSHPHALQPYDIIKTQDNRSIPVIYSMGNFLSQMTRDVSKQTIILSLTLKKNNNDIVITNEGYIPCRVFPKYKDNRYVILPLVAPYSLKYSLPMSSYYIKQIKEIIGTKLKILK